MSQTNITPELEQVFQELTSGGSDDFALFSYFVNGKSAVAICYIQRDEEDYYIHPLFVSITEDMTLTNRDGEEPTDE